ncbi:DUF222 domain-containing protein [Microbacterium sp. NPDC090225]|uniref:HNH endonuclease signature motif containing protein n=1 Tax=Microbacterium sp. NPDC090225 TaxID=3364207 RepID=UPI00382D281F
MTEVLDATDSQTAMIADLVGSVRAVEETIARLFAVRDGMLAVASRVAIDIARQAAHPDHGDMALRAVAAEIGAAVRVSDRTIERRMDEASWTVERFVEVWAAQGAGRISAAHARVIVDAGAHLDDPADRARYAARAVEAAVVESPNRLRRVARRIAEQYQARTVTERHQDARELRRVWVKDLDDGMAELGMLGPAVLVHGIHDRLTRMARTITLENGRAGQAAKPGTAPAPRPMSLPAAPDADAAADITDATAGVGSDSRTMDQLRADLLADIALTGAPTGHDTEAGLLGEIRARVEVTVPVFTLMDDDTGGHNGGSASGAPPAELDGRSPIDTRTARLLAGDATGWERVLTHPITGALLAVDRYRPSDQLTRHLRARDQRCRFPGCNIAARRCDIDHTHAASDGGETCATNLAHLCRRHHTLKHHSRWRVEHGRPGEDDVGPDREGGETDETPRTTGDLVWTSPTGTTYVDRPPEQNTVRFTDRK